MHMVGPESVAQALLSHHMLPSFCAFGGDRAVNFFQPLIAAGVEFGSRNVLADPAIREAIKEYSQWPTIPQVMFPPE